MSYPSQWQTFCRWHRANGIAALPAHLDLPKLNRFAARYRLAKSFRGLDVEGYANASTGDAYSSVMLAFLAYSALEQLHEATKEKPDSICMTAGLIWRSRPRQNYGGLRRYCYSCKCRWIQEDSETTYRSSSMVRPITHSTWPLRCAMPLRTAL